MIKDFEQRHLGIDADLSERIKKQALFSLVSPDFEAHTVFDGDKVIAIIGYHFLYPGVIDLFGIVCKGIKEHGRALYTGLHEIIALSNDRGVHRAQFNVYPEHEKAIKFAEALGAKREGLLKKHLPNREGYSDVYLYAWVKDD